MKIKPEENKISGYRVTNGRNVFLQENRKRIENLCSDYLNCLSIGNWIALFQDPHDDRYWEKTYQLGNMHGGGPPSLTCITTEQAIKRYPTWAKNYNSTKQNPILED